jgi:transcriptional regulator with XRE-family HTH domain
MRAVEWRPNVRAIEEARIRQCWTLRRLSREARLSYPTVINLLLGRTQPNFATLQQLGKALDLSTVDLVAFIAQPTESDRPIDGAAKSGLGRCR